MDATPVFADLPPGLGFYDIRRRFVDRAKRIDTVSRAVFPMSFLVFNVLYWLTYKVLRHEDLLAALWRCTHTWTGRTLDTFNSALYQTFTGWESSLEPNKMRCDGTSSFLTWKGHWFCWNFNTGKEKALLIGHCCSVHYMSTSGSRHTCVHPHICRGFIYFESTNLSDTRKFNITVALKRTSEKEYNRTTPPRFSP